MTTPRKIRWLIAHQPEELFLRTARAFSEELKNLGENSLEVEILTYADYVSKYPSIPGLDGMNYNPNDLEKFEEGVRAFWQALTDSDIEMSQIQVVRVGDLDKDFYALDLPYLFDDHEHASRVLEGEIGDQLCRQLGEKSGVTGLAFTYSGGFRVIGSTEPLMTLDDVFKTHMAVQQPLSLATSLEHANKDFKYEMTSPNFWHKHDPLGPDGNCNAVETTYLRFNHTQGKHILRTNHSMFLTTVLVSNKFWDSLTEEQQTNFRIAARRAARRERQWSIEDAERFEDEAAENGVSIKDLSAEDQQTLRHLSQIVYTKTKYYFTPNLVKKIRTSH